MKATVVEPVMTVGVIGRRLREAAHEVTGLDLIKNADSLSVHSKRMEDANELFDS